MIARTSHQAEIGWVVRKSLKEQQAKVRHRPTMAIAYPSHGPRDEFSDFLETSLIYATQDNDQVTRLGESFPGLVEDFSDQHTDSAALVGHRRIFLATDPGVG